MEPRPVYHTPVRELDDLERGGYAACLQELRELRRLVTHQQEQLDTLTRIVASIGGRVNLDVEYGRILELRKETA